MKAFVFVLCVGMLWALGLAAGAHASEPAPEGKKVASASKPTAAPALRKQEVITESESVAYLTVLAQLERLRTEISETHGLTNKDTFDAMTRVIVRNANVQVAAAPAEPKKNKK